MFLLDCRALIKGKRRPQAEKVVGLVRRKMCIGIVSEEAPGLRKGRDVRKKRGKSISVGER